MATLSGFTRVSDPIEVNTLVSKILTDTGLNVTANVTPTDIDVTGSISESNRTAIQNSINSYYYPLTQVGVPIVDNPDMSGKRHDRAVTEYASYMADSTVAGMVGKLQTSAGIVYGAWPYPFTATTNSSGVATVYLTSDGTSTGTIAFSTVYAQSATPIPVGPNSNYQVVSSVISADKKTLTITVNQLGSVVLGLVSLTSAAAGVVVQGTVWGK